MPVYKYRSFEEAERALWNFRPSEAYFQEVAELWRWADALCPMRYPRGVFKYRTFEEANRARDQWELAHAIEVQARMRSTIHKQEPPTR
jgi:hypothetical protein